MLVLIASTMEFLYVAVCLAHVLALLHAVESAEYHRRFRAVSRLVLIGWGLVAVALGLMLFTTVTTSTVGDLALFPLFAAYLWFQVIYPAHVGVGVWAAFRTKSRRAVWWTVLNLPVGCVLWVAIWRLWS